MCITDCSFSLALCCRHTPQPGRSGPALSLLHLLRFMFSFHPPSLLLTTIMSKHEAQVSPDSVLIIIGFNMQCKVRHSCKCVKSIVVTFLCRQGTTVGPTCWSYDTDPEGGYEVMKSYTNELSDLFPGQVSCVIFRLHNLFLLWSHASLSPPAASGTPPRVCILRSDHKLKFISLCSVRVRSLYVGFAHPCVQDVADKFIRCCETCTFCFTVWC